MNPNSSGNPAKMTSSFIQLVLQAAKKALLFVGLFSLFANILMLTVPLYMLQLFDRVFASYSIDTLGYLTIVAVFALIAFGCLDVARNRVAAVLSHWLDKKVSPEAIGASADAMLQGRSYAGQALRDLRSIQNFLTSSGMIALFDSPWVPIYLLVIFLLHPALGLLATIGAILLFTMALFNEKWTHDLLNESNTQQLVAQQHVDSSLRNAETIQAMGMMPNLIRHWQSKYDPSLKIQEKVSHRSNIMVSLSKFIRLTLQIFMLGLGAYFVVFNEITPGVMIAASILMARALSPVEQSIAVWKQLVQAIQAYKRLKIHLALSTTRTAGIELPEPKGELTLEQVMYMAPGYMKPIVNNINLSIKPGKLVVMIGPTGAGKSTIARLMVGAWQPNYGKVRLDGADVYNWQRDQFGRYVGYLPQDVQLFPGTIKDNIARLAEIDDAAVIEAAQLAGVHDLILHLPQGYDTHVQSSIINLSGGQRQRIALARALYKNPKLLILDEPNSNLDTEGEKALVLALGKMREIGTTQVVITHRPGILQIADEIILVNEGNIQLSGPRDEVLSKLQPAASQTPKTWPSNIS